MPDVEKVVAGLEWMAESYIGLVSDISKDALALLKAQEPRLMTLEEIRECVTYWIEDETGHIVPETVMDMTGKNIMTIPVVHLTNGYAPIITKTTDGYNSKHFTGWRCWTSRPTDEQREAVKWNDPE